MDRRGAKHPLWKGGRKLQAGYAMVMRPDHPRAAANKGYVFEHILVVEEALGHYLPEGAVVHHADRVKTDNRKDNLAALQNDAEHASLHARLRVLRAGGNPWTERLCGHCRRTKPFDQFGPHAHWCRACTKAYDRKHFDRTPREHCHPGSKLTEDQVRAIRAAVRGGERQVDVARRFNTTKFVVNDIVKGRKYKSVTEAA